MSTKPYGLICPITRACDLLEPRWSIPILSELWAGSTKFNELRRGVGSISPALLSRRLKELEQHGLIERIEKIIVIGIIRGRLRRCLCGGFLDIDRA